MSNRYGYFLYYSAFILFVGLLSCSHVPAKKVIEIQAFKELSSNPVDDEMAAPVTNSFRFGMGLFQSAYPEDEAAEIFRSKGIHAIYYCESTCAVTSAEETPLSSYVVKNKDRKRFITGCSDGIHGEEHESYCFSAKEYASRFNLKMLELMKIRN